MFDAVAFPTRQGLGPPLPTFVLSLMRLSSNQDSRLRNRRTRWRYSLPFVVSGAAIEMSGRAAGIGGLEPADAPSAPGRSQKRSPRKVMEHGSFTQPASISSPMVHQ